MWLFDLTKHTAKPVDAFESKGVESAELAAGQGEAHVHMVRMCPDGVIGTHEAGFDQLFAVVSGKGWLKSERGRLDLTAGQVGFVARGEMHSKGAVTDLVALIIQVTDLRTTGQRASSVP